MHRPRGKMASSNYWPGYVDALTNVVLNLLFLVAIFAMGVFSLGMEAGKKRALPEVYHKAITPPEPPPPVKILSTDLAKRKGSPVQDSAEPNVPALPGPVNDPVLLIRVEPAAQNPAAPGVTLDKVTREAGSVMLTLAFPEAALQIPPASRDAILARAGSDIKASHGQFIVWAVGGVADPVNRRAAYLRVMAVRDLLIGQGVAPERIETRLLDGDSRRKASQAVYVVMKTDS